MSNKSIGIIVASALLSACGGGGGGGGSNDDSPTPADPNALTGTFVDSPVAGLRYETPSHSGLTNADGEFYYLAGESITFSIGGTQLGSTRASNMITPFSLSGILPVSKEAEIIASLSSDNVNSYDRALNIATLLQSLDADGNPGNGIDLGSSHTELQANSVDLFVKATAFTEQDELSIVRQKMQRLHRTTLDEAIAHIYESLEVEIESSQVASFVSEVNNRTVETISYEYDASGNITVENTDTNNDGIPEFTKEYSYDENGNVTRIENTANSTVETMEYDINNNILSRSIDRPDTDNDTEETYSYISGRLVRLDVEQGSGESRVTTYSYNAEGEITTHASDLDGDGENDSVAEYTYYPNGEIASYIEDNNNDGIPSLIITYIEDEDGNPNTQKIEISQDSIPTSASTFVYDDLGNVVVYEQDSNLDGIIDYIETYRYNADNQRTQYTRDFDADGRPEMVAQYEYDVNGNRTRMIEDSDGNGIVDKIWEGSYQAAILEDSWDTILGQL